MIQIMRLLIYIVSCLGRWELLRRNTKVNKYFLPGCVVAVDTTLLFMAGILNVLKEMSLLIWISGLIYLIFVIVKERSLQFIKEYVDPGYLFCGIILVVMYIFVKGKIFTHYDNFSHWALVIRRMLLTDRFPNFLDSIIHFQEYPLGSAVYIYFWSKIVGANEGSQMLAQIYMMAVSVMPLFTFAKKNKGAALFAILAAANLFFVYNTTVTNLLVDTLLPLVSMSGILYIFFYGRKTQDKVAYYLCAAYLIQIVQIKNSGVFFIALAIGLILYRAVKDKNYLQSLIISIAPILSIVIWQKHCKYVFKAAAGSKHAMTIDNYKAVFGDKTPEDIRNIIRMMIRFLLTDKETWFCFGVFAVATVLVCVFIKELKALSVKLFVIAIISYLAYQAGNLAMYMFSMPLYEAEKLASIDRYTNSILISVIYLLMVIAISIISHLSVKWLKPWIAAGLSIVVSFMFTFVSFGKIKLAWDYMDTGETRRWMEKQIQEYKLPQGESYEILLSVEDGGYTRYMGSYLLQTDNVKSMKVGKVEELNSIRAKYVLIFDEENELIQDWIKEQYPDQIGNSVIIVGEK